MPVCCNHWDRAEQSWSPVPCGASAVTVRQLGQGSCERPETVKDKLHVRAQAVQYCMIPKEKSFLWSLFSDSSTRVLYATCCPFGDDFTYIFLAFYPYEGYPSKGNVTTCARLFTECLQLLFFAAFHRKQYSTQRRCSSVMDLIDDKTCIPFALKATTQSLRREADRIVGLRKTSESRLKYFT